MKTTGTDNIMQNKAFVWVALATGLILLIPLVAIQFTDEVAWTLIDFAAAGTLLIGAGSTFVLTARMPPRYRVVVGIVLAAAFLWVWAELAVGVVTTLGS